MTRFGVQFRLLCRGVACYAPTENSAQDLRLLRPVAGLMIESQTELESRSSAFSFLFLPFFFLLSSWLQLRRDFLDNTLHFW